MASSGDDNSSEQRGATRFGVVMPARCKSPPGRVERVVVTDLSVTGCRVESASLNLCEGEEIIVRVNGLEGLGGKVRWAGRNAAGIVFDRPLYQPVVEHLHRNHAEFLADVEPAPTDVKRRV
jgi:hypothetical protein